MKQAGYRFYYDPEIVSKRETRGTLRGLLRQKYLNGYWIGRTLAVQPRCFSVYHFVPLLFVLAIVLAAALALCGVTWPGIALACAYGCANAAMTVMTVIGSPDRNIGFICLPVIFFLPAVDPIDAGLRPFGLADNKETVSAHHDKSQPVRVDKLIFGCVVCYAVLSAAVSAMSGISRRSTGGSSVVFTKETMRSSAPALSNAWRKKR
jgi:hypothetical protein